MAALKQPTIKVVAIIAEGVPESDAKQLIAYAKANNKVNYFLVFRSLSFELYFVSLLTAVYINCKRELG